MSNKEVLLVFGVIIVLFVVIFRYKHIERFLFNRKHCDNFVSIGLGSVFCCLGCMAIRLILNFIHSFVTNKWIDTYDFDSYWGIFHNGLPYVAGLAVLVSIIKVLKHEKSIARIICRCIYIISICSLALALGNIAGFLIVAIFPLWFFFRGYKNNNTVIYQ